MVAERYNLDWVQGALRTAITMEHSTLLQLDDAFTGSSSALDPAVPSMCKLRDQGLILLANPLPDHPGRHARPTFEWGAA